MHPRGVLGPESVKRCSSVHTRDNRPTDCQFQRRESTEQVGFGRRVDPMPHPDYRAGRDASGQCLRIHRSKNLSAGGETAVRSEYLIDEHPAIVHSMPPDG